MHGRERHISTADDLILSPIHRQPIPPGTPPSGLSREDAVVTSWLEQAGRTCGGCGHPMTKMHHARRPTLALVDPEGRATLSNIIVLCARCAEDR